MHEYFRLSMVCWNSQFQTASNGWILIIICII
jgi:hypothetical protein